MFDHNRDFYNLLSFKHPTINGVRFKLCFIAYFLLIFFWADNSSATQIVFFKSFRPNGEPVVFEGLYSHVAISFKNQWLHAHPYYGISLSEDLTQFGPNYVLLENPNYPEPSVTFVNQQLKMKFNIFAQWQSPHETYCSKLVGQALNMTPTKMRFKSKNWQRTNALKHRGELGLSPSDLYWHVRRNLGFKKALIIPESLYKKKNLNSCASFF